METRLRLGSYRPMFCRMPQTLLLHCRAPWNKKLRLILNFARFDSFVCIVARSREKSRSLSLAPFLARSRSRLQVYKHMILSVTHSTQSICNKFTSNWNNPGWGDRLPTIWQRITVRRQHNRTIRKLSVWNSRPEQLSSDSPTIGWYNSTMGLSS